jgi:hypothetical protein
MVTLAMLLVSLESHGCLGMHQGGFVMFRLMVQEVVELCHQKFNKIKNNFLKEIGGKFLVLLESS